MSNRRSVIDWMVWPAVAGSWRISQSVSDRLCQHDPVRRTMSVAASTVRSMAEIIYVRGDAISPQAKGVKVIAHVCNDRGGWGKGFVLAISRRWSQPEAAFRSWYRGRSSNDFGLGALQLVRVEPYIWVANMIGQHGTKTSRSAGTPIRYDAVDQCLQTLAESAIELGASVHMPRIGCGLGGGKWERIEPLITRRLSERGITVTVYDHRPG
jgi:O-acetyl-ADP-ribose deacetylase (regulator of RNase III)